MIGYIRLFKRESCIIEPKKAQVKVKDLRLYNPWPELLAYANSFDIGSLPEVEHIHVPLAVILIQALNNWKSTHQGLAPKTQAEKSEFVASIKAMNKHGSKSLNFAEAVSSVLECYKSDALPHNLQTVFSKVTDQQTSAFWVCAAGLKAFYEANGQLPVSGVLPDMVSTTDFYL